MFVYSHEFHKVLKTFNGSKQVLVVEACGCYIFMTLTEVDLRFKSDRASQCFTLIPCVG